MTALDLLLSRARAIASGEDQWAHSDLRAALVSRIGAGNDPLGEQYSAIRSAADRRAQGVTLTPQRVVKAMVDWAKKEAAALGSPQRIVDPGAGTGRFTIAAAAQFPKAEIIAVENNSDLLLLLRANLRAIELDSRVKVLGEDFRALRLEPITGPTLFIGNPPYVRHHGISPEWKSWYAQACARHGISASRLAGLHLHFFARIAEIGKDGDFGCLITAAEWLDVGYGAALRSLLADRLGGTEIHILHPTAEAFPGTMSTAAITGFRVGRRPAMLRLRGVDQPSQLDRLKGGRQIPWKKLRQEPKWSILVRGAPKPPPGTIELGELCRVHRGQVTGSNRVWIAGKHALGLPDRFLRPTITRAKELIKAEPTLEDHRHLARVVDLPGSLDEIEAAERVAVERFIGWAREVGAADGYIARHRSPWWAVRLARPAPIVCTYMARRVPAFVRNRAGAHLLNIAHGIFPRDEFSDDQLLRLTAVLRASVRRDQGRTYSGGLTKFEPREIERIPISWSDAANAS
ncbi:MAG: class I SAM-dependent methyltransferase [Stellaceae bacterium]